MTTVEPQVRDHVIYLTGVSTPITRAAHRDDLGLLVTPASGIASQLEHYAVAGADNGCYVESKAGKPFDGDRWLRWIENLPRSLAFVALPDVLDWITDPDTGKRFPVGNLDATLERSARYFDTVAELGFRPAFVMQDGLTDLDAFPYPIGAVFVGGSDAYKLGPAARSVLCQARERGLWTHAGRVNSFKRLAYFDALGCDSADGTTILYAPALNAPRVMGWLDRLAQDRRML